VNSRSWTLPQKASTIAKLRATLGLSVATIKHYISLVVRKWGVRNRVEAVVLHSRKPTGS
jgi:DNA-binding NarL/FixJ family response regulator